MWRILFLLCCLPGLAAAQDVVTDMPGLYGSASDPAGSCDSNPHRLELLARPPHLFLSWEAPWINAAGETVYNRRYDVLGVDGQTFLLRNEDEQVFTDDGQRPVWILRRTSDPEGYCWGRTDWPQMHCEDQQLRCDAPVS